MSDEKKQTATEPLNVQNVNDRLDRLRGDIGRMVGIFVEDLQRHFAGREPAQIVEHPEGADSQTKKLGELRDKRFGPDPIPGADATPAFRWSPELLTDMVAARARRDGRAIKLSTYAGEIDRKSAVELRDWLDAVLDDRERWPTMILQAAKPGDVVFVEAQRDLSDDEMMSIKAMCESLSLSVKIVVLPKDMKVAGTPSACTCGAGRNTPHDRTCPEAEPNL